MTSFEGPSCISKSGKVNLPKKSSWLSFGLLNSGPMCLTLPSSEKLGIKKPQNGGGVCCEQPVGCPARSWRESGTQFTWEPFVSLALPANQAPFISARQIAP